ncbi:hypothetical protein TGAMA5MH_05947 [Trichoderma gamsii]|uniref:Uncharacterized protein n=1 Tax=Trichoderma gamsii TaxID=398673 RepID=A0A2K0T9S0_9HYPO|nr:hypothetical protein TGAMA5MH_05947 [Trichoderma gamsii]
MEATEREVMERIIVASSSRLKRGRLGGCGGRRRRPRRGGSGLIGNRRDESNATPDLDQLEGQEEFQWRAEVLQQEYQERARLEQEQQQQQQLMRDGEREEYGSTIAALQQDLARVRTRAGEAPGGEAEVAGGEEVWAGEAMDLEMEVEGGGEEEVEEKKAEEKKAEEKKE